MSCEYPADMAQAKVSQSASFPQSPKLKEVTATLQDVVIDKREETRSVEVAKCLTIVLRGFRTLHFFKEDCASDVRITGKRSALKLKDLPKLMTISS
jgi:hypothetical protein